MKMAQHEDFHISFENLLKQGFGVIDVRYKEYDVTNEPLKYIIARIESDRDEFYPNMLKAYTGIELKPNEVFDLWIEILKHKISMSKVLDRDIAIKVAALDYIETRYKPKQ